jgi:hypothetical protein
MMIQRATSTDTETKLVDIGTNAQRALAATQYRTIAGKCHLHGSEVRRMGQKYDAWAGCVTHGPEV